MSAVNLTTPPEDAALIRAVLPLKPRENLGVMLGCARSTVRSWMERGITTARRREVALALLAEMDRQDEERAAWRAALKTMAGEHEGAGVVVDSDAVARTRNSTAADLCDAAADGLDSLALRVLFRVYNQPSRP
jgi:hypothetical protein